MEAEDFVATISKLCVLEQRGSDTDMREEILSFAAELGVEGVTDEVLARWFKFDDGTVPTSG